MKNMEIKFGYSFGLMVLICFFIIWKWDWLTGDGPAKQSLTDYSETFFINGRVFGYKEIVGFLPVLKEDCVAYQKASVEARRIKAENDKYRQDKSKKNIALYSPSNAFNGLRIDKKYLVDICNKT